MSITAIICEYNPFHNGHLFHLQMACEASGNQNILCLMSGSLVQRGEPAIFDKWARAQMALSGGASLVVELPTVFAVGSAPRFAAGAVSILNRIPDVAFLAFGAEAEHPEDLWTLAQIMAEAPASWDTDIKKGLGQGLSYAKARQLATQNLLKAKGYYRLAEECQHLMASPNNILALEYCLALINSDSAIKPLFINRQGEGYHSLKPSSLPSATFIRSLLRSSPPLNQLSTMVPGPTLNIIKEEIELGRGPVYAENAEILLLYHLRNLSLAEMERLADMEPGLASRIKAAAQKAGTREDLRLLIKSKRHAMTRIDRILLYSLLGLTKDDILFYDSHTPSYLRVLGCSPSGKKILQEIRSKCDLWIINRVKPSLDKMKKAGHPDLRALELDIKATDLRSVLSDNPRARHAGQDFTRSPIVV